MTSDDKEKTCCKKFQHVIFGSMEKFFDKLGNQVAKKPLTTILISVTLAGLLMIGLIRYREETNKNELWLPSNSDTYRQSKWLEKMFPSTTRFQQYMLASKSGENVLTKDNLLMLVDVSEDITNIR